MRFRSAVVLAAAALAGGGVLGYAALDVASSWGRGPAAAWAVARLVALATLLIAAAGFAVSIHLRRHRFNPGHCPRCGFNLRATPYRCPECGDMWLLRRT